MNIREVILEICDGDREKAAIVEGVAEKLAKEFLALKDYAIVPCDPFEVEKTGDFRRRLRISPSHFARRLDSPHCPPFEVVEAGQKGSIRKLRSNPAFEKWMQKTTQLDRTPRR